MIGDQELEQYENELGEDARTLLRAISALEDWTSDQEPEPSKALHRLAAELRKPGVAQKLAKMDAKTGLGLAGGFRYPRALLWIKVILDYGQPALSRMLGQQNEADEEIYRATLYNRLLYLARLHLLSQVLDPERRRRLKVALELAGSQTTGEQA